MFTEHNHAAEFEDALAHAPKPALRYAVGFRRLQFRVQGLGYGVVGFRVFVADTRPLSSEYGTHKRVKTSLWPWLSGGNP